uniref:Uncharacterized protein n=1 Tax=Oryza punctata TaxID=4537 RepID=A0A0E0MJ21_ORYPU
MPNIMPIPAQPSPEVVIESNQPKERRRRSKPPKSLFSIGDGESTCDAPCEKKRLIPSCFGVGDEEDEDGLSIVRRREEEGGEEAGEGGGGEAAVARRRWLASTARHKEILLQAIDSIKASAISIRERQDAIRVQFDVPADASDSDTDDHDMHPRCN